MDLRSYSSQSKGGSGTQHNSAEQQNQKGAGSDQMNEKDVRRAINHFSKMSNDQLMRELSRLLIAKKAKGQGSEIAAVIERIKPLLNDEQRRRLTEIMEKIN